MTTRCHTYTGQGFDPFNPRPEDVRIKDIAHHLAMTCRYGGAVPVFYSVAEHAVRTARLVEEISGDPTWAMLALHHDSAEAYIHDIRRPIKHAILMRYRFVMGLFPADHNGPVSFSDLEDKILAVIHECIGIQPNEEAETLIHDADECMLKREMEGLLGETVTYQAIRRPKLLSTETWAWSRAEAEFLKTHERIRRSMAAVRRAGVVL